MKKSSICLTFFQPSTHNMYMRKFLANLSELKKMLLLAAVVSLFLIAGSCVGLFFNQPGWLIGVAIGSVVEIINIILLYKGSSEVLKAEKPGMFLLFYALRMILFVGVVLVLVLLQYKANIEPFYYSFWGALIGYTPMQIIVIIVSVRSKHKNSEKTNG